MGMAVAVLALAALTASPLAAAAGQQAPPPKTDCSSPEYRQFDFWLGSWNVTVQGKNAGTNRIESAMSGCALVEHWTSASGGQGTSLNFYDRQTKSWSQAWIDESGNALHLKGGINGGRMILQSEPQATEKGQSFSASRGPASPRAGCASCGNPRRTTARPGRWPSTDSMYRARSPGDDAARGPAWSGAARRSEASRRPA